MISHLFLKNNDTTAQKLNTFDSKKLFSVQFRTLGHFMFLLP